MSETHSILNANEAFYAAFAGACIDTMDDVWSQNAEVTCIHPGWPALSGRMEVLDSWRSILSTEPPLISFHNAQVYHHGDVGYVICKEHLEPGALIATNVFVRENGQWKMVHHQAGIIPAGFEEPISQGSRTLQ